MHKGSLRGLFRFCIFPALVVTILLTTLFCARPVLSVGTIDRSSGGHDRITYYIPFEELGKLPSLDGNTMIMLPFSELQGLEDNIGKLKTKLGARGPSSEPVKRDPAVELPQWTIEQLDIQARVEPAAIAGQADKETPPGHLVSGTIRARVTVNSGGLVSVPMISGRLTMVKPEWDSATTMISSRNLGQDSPFGQDSQKESSKVLPYVQYSLLFWKEGTYQVNLSFLGSPSSAGGRNTFAFEPGPAVSGMAEFIIPQGSVEGGFLRHLGLQRTSEKGFSRITSRLLPSGEMAFNFHVRKDAPPKSDPGTVTIAQVEGPEQQLQRPSATEPEKVKEATTVQKAPEVVRKIEPKIFSEQATLLSIGDRLIQGVAVFDYQIRRAQLSNLQISFPEGLEILEVSCLDMDTWALLPASAKASEPRRLSISLNIPFKGDKRVVVVFEKRLEDTPGTPPEKVAIPTLSTLSCERELGCTGVEALTSVEVEEAGGNTSVRIDPSELPDHISGLARNPVIMAFRNSRTPSPLSLSIKRFMGAQVLSTYAEKASLALIRTENGKTLTRMNLKIKNKGKQFLKLDIPAKARVLNTFVDGVPEKASRGEDGKVWIPLVQSGEDSTFPVQLVYEENSGEILSSFGRESFQVPASDVPMGAVSLSLYLPENYTYASFKGDMEQVTRDEEHILYLISRSAIAAAASALKWSFGLAILLAGLALAARVFLKIPFRTIGGALAGAGTKVATSAFSFLTNMAAIFVVVLVVGLLFAISVPNFSKARKQARVKSCIANMRTTEGAIEMFDMDASGELPELSSTSFLCNSSGRCGPLMEKIIAGRYLKTPPTCKSGGSYYNVVESRGDNHVACTMHGTVTNPVEGGYQIPSVPSGAQMEFFSSITEDKSISVHYKKGSEKRRRSDSSKRSRPAAPGKAYKEDVVGNFEPLQESKPRLQTSADASQATEARGRARGVLPVPVRIPGSSNVYHFTRIMVPAGEGLKLASLFFGRFALKGLYGLFALAGLLAAMGCLGVMYWPERKALYSAMALTGILATIAGEGYIDSGIRFSTRAGLLVPILGVIGFKVFVLASHLPVFLDWAGRMKKSLSDRIFSRVTLMILFLAMSALILGNEVFITPALALEEQALWIPYKKITETGIFGNDREMVFIPYSRFTGLKRSLSSLEKQLQVLTLGDRTKENSGEVKPSWPCVSSVLSMAHHCVAGPGALKVTTSIEIIKYSPERAEIPLISSDCAVVSARLNGKETTLVRRPESSFLSLITELQGSLRLEIVHFVRTETFKAGYRVSFAHCQTSTETLTLETGPGNFNLDFPSALLTGTRGDQEKGRLLDYALSPARGVNFTCEPQVSDPFGVRSSRKRRSSGKPAQVAQPAVTAPVAAPTEISRETRKPKIFATVESMYRMSDTLMRVSSCIHYDVKFGSVGVFEIQLPGDVEIVSVGDDDNLKWEQVSPEAGEPNAMRIAVYLPSPKRGSFDLPLKFERVVSEGADRIAVPTVKTLGSERENGHIGVEVSSSMEVRVDTSANSVTIDPARLPGTLRLMAQRPVVLAMKYTRQPFELNLKVKKSEELPMVTAMIDTARFSTYISPRGTLLTEAVFNVRNNHEQFLKLRLPKGHSIWTVTVDGKTAKPGMVSEREAAIPIRKSLGQGDALSTFEVRVLSCAQGGEMGDIVDMTLTLPEVLNIGITQMEWTLGLPETHRLITWEGDVSAASESPAGRFLNDDMVYKSGAPAEKKVVSRSNRELIKGISVPLPEGMDGEGLLSVRVRVPSSSRTHRFTAKLLDAGAASPELKIVCGSNRLEKRAYGVTYMAGVGMCLLFWWGLRRSGKRGITAMIATIVIGSMYLLQDYLMMILDIFGLGLAMGVISLVFFLMVKPWNLD